MEPRLKWSKIILAAKIILFHFRGGSMTWNHGFKQGWRTRRHFCERYKTKQKFRNCWDGRPWLTESQFFPSPIYNTPSLEEVSVSVGWSGSPSNTSQCGSCHTKNQSDPFRRLATVHQRHTMLYLIMLHLCSMYLLRCRLNWELRIDTETTCR